MKRFIFLLMAAILVITACQPSAPKSPIKVVKETKDSITKEYEMDTVKGVKHGYFKEYYTSGELYLEKQFKNDTLVGVVKHYHKNGAIQDEAEVKDGKLTGYFKAFYEDGKVYQEGTHVDEYYQGPLKTYHPNGQLKELITMVNAIPEGPFEEFFDNGKPKAKGTYLAGKEHCLLELYKEDASGELERKMLCKNGVSCTFWTAEKGFEKNSTAICKEIFDEMFDACNIDKNALQ